MKKFLSVLLICTMALTLLAGCGSGSSDSEKSDTDAKTSTSDGSALFSPVAKEDIKVGVIHLSDPAEGSGYTYTHDVGIVDMQKNLGLEDSQIIRKNNVSDDDPTAVETAINECLEEGCNIIFATSWGYMDTVEKLASEYPEVMFCHATGYKSNGSNFINYFGRIYQARYLAGIAAGLKTKSNKIGYVAAMGKDNSEVTGGIDAFALGIYSVNPDAEVYVKVTNSWYDPEGETQAAQALVDSGCDVISQHCDTPNPQIVAEDAGVWGVGYNSDMSKDAPDAVLCSVVWNWGAYYTQAVESMIDGTWTGENYFGGIAQDLEGITDLSDFNDKEAAAKIEEAKKSMLDGSFNVFDGVIETNDGSKVGKEGSTLSDSDITGGINWYFKTVKVK